jgi:hypothetical protein
LDSDCYSRIKTGFDPKTIRKYLNQNELPKKKQPHGKLKPSLLDPYKDYLLRRLKEGITNCEVLLEEIQSMGYPGKMTILRDFIRPYRQKPKMVKNTSAYGIISAMRVPIPAFLSYSFINASNMAKYGLSYVTMLVDDSFFVHHQKVR